MIIVTSVPPIKFIYKDELRDMLDLGEARVRRASHVEPCGTQWTADMSPVGGPLLGPYNLRKDALAAEVKWLGEHMGELCESQG